MNNDKLTAAGRPDPVQQENSLGQGLSMLAPAGELSNTPTSGHTPAHWARFPAGGIQPGTGIFKSLPEDFKGQPSLRSSGLRPATPWESRVGSMGVASARGCPRWGFSPLCCPVRRGHILGCSPPEQASESPVFSICLLPSIPNPFPPPPRPSSCVTCAVVRASNYLPQSATGLSQDLVPMAAPVICLKNRSRHTFL